MGRPGTPLGRPGTPLGRLGTPLGPTGTSLRPPGTLLEPPGTPGTPMGPLMDHKNGHISTNRQRQKLSIAVPEAAHEGPSHGALDRVVFSIKKQPKSTNWQGGPPMEILGGAKAQTQEVSLYIRYYNVMEACCSLFLCFRIDSCSRY